jgi:Na+-driven multidrug efflux pump
MSIIGLYSPFQMIWLAVGAILSVGSQVLCARYMGAGDLDRTRGVFTLTLTTALCGGILSMVLSFLIPDQIATILGVAPDALDQLSGFVIGRGIGQIPLIIGSMLSGFLELEGKNRINYISTLFLVIFNITLDLLFANYANMGIKGLGCATSLSQWGYMCMAGWFFLTKKASLKFNLKLIRWKELWEMTKVGAPSAIVFFLTAIRSNLFNNSLNAYDPTMISVAAISTYAMTLMIFESVGKGVAASGRLLASVSYGEEDGRSMTAIMNLVFSKGMLIVLAACALTFFLASPMTSLFYADTGSRVHQLTADALKLGAIALFFESVAAIFSNYFQAIGRNVMVNYMSVMEGFGVALPLGLILIPSMGIDGCITAYLIGYAVLALLGPVYAIFYWKRMPKGLSEWLTIPKDFGAAEDECLDASIHSLEDAVAISKDIRSFCEGKVDSRKAYFASLAVEEMCLGIIKERFDENDKKHTIEVRVVHKGDDIFLSLKDDCRIFNPQDRADLVNPRDDSPKSLSIRTFMGVVKETEYQQTLGINVFTATV